MKNPHAYLGILFGSLLCGLAGAQTPASSSATLYYTSSGYVRVGSAPAYVNAGTVARLHDFGTTGGFSKDGTARLATIVAANTNNIQTVLSGNVGNGLPGRAEWSATGVTMQNIAGEGQAGTLCRAQASSFALLPDVPLVWNLRFKLGDATVARKWQFLPTGKDPVLLWQVKPPTTSPSIAFFADTDNLNPSKLQLVFGVTDDSINPNTTLRAGEVHGLSDGTMIDVHIEAQLDERTVAAGGKGYWKAWVNGKQVVNRVGPTLRAGVKEPHQWFFGIYRYNTVCPSSVARYTLWETLRLDMAK